jgi:putative acetyltransferase
MKIMKGDFENEQVIALLRLHLNAMHENSPVGSVYALDLSALDTPEIDFWTAWDDNVLLGCGAIKFLSTSTAEIKSMRTHPAHLRKGVGRNLLLHLIDQAKTKGCNRMSLETGSGATFDAALALYRDFGFKNGNAFADYAATDFNQFLHLDLE